MRKKIYNSVDELQQDLDTWLHYYNHERPHSGKFCYGKTPIQTFIDSKKLECQKPLLQLQEKWPVCFIDF